MQARLELAATGGEPARAAIAGRVTGTASTGPGIDRIMGTEGQPAPPGDVA